MTTLGHILLFLCSAAVIWCLSGLLINAVDRVSHRLHRSGFISAFFILGILTSVSEMSVAVNATLEGAPQISAGNLIGASLVLFLLVIPILAIAGNGVNLRRALPKGSLALTLLVIAAPALLSLDGRVSPSEGIMMILLYLALLYCIQRRKPIERGMKKTIKKVHSELLQKKKTTILDIVKLTIGAVIIFKAAMILVNETVFLAGAFHIPASLIGLLLLAIGTNIPELVIAFRSIGRGHKDIAFGNYMGSAAANTLIFGFLALANGSFAVEQTGFLTTFLLFAGGLLFFYVFAMTKHMLSRSEGFVLFGVYVIFLVCQIVNIVEWQVGH